MSQKPETIFRQKFRKKLDEIPNSWFESIQQKAISGTPDLLGCVNGLFIALELKATAKEKPSKLQELKLKQIGNSGGLGIIVNPENAKDVLELIKNIGEKNA